MASLTLSMLQSLDGALDGHSGAQELPPPMIARRLWAGLPRAPLRVITAVVVFAHLVSGAAALAQSVSVTAGRVVYRDASGQSREVTRSGLDTMPALSPDGRLITFIRRTPDDSVATAIDRDERTELWVVRADGSGERRLIRGHDATEPRRTLAGMANPAFSADGTTVYVESDGWVTSAAVHAVSVATGAERFVCPANGFEVLLRGRYRGDLLVEQHRNRASGAYDGTWIIAPDGRTVQQVTLAMAADAEARKSAARDGRAARRARGANTKQDPDTTA